MGEHVSNRRPSNREKHEEGQARQQKDAEKKEKGDKRRKDHFKRRRNRPQNEGDQK
jgi:hypothetical protein